MAQSHDNWQGDLIPYHVDLSIGLSVLMILQLAFPGQARKNL